MAHQLRVHTVLTEDPEFGSQCAHQAADIVFESPATEVCYMSTDFLLCFKEYVSPRVHMLDRTSSPPARQVSMGNSSSIWDSAWLGLCVYSTLVTLVCVVLVHASSNNVLSNLEPHHLACTPALNNRASLSSPKN